MGSAIVAVAAEDDLFTIRAEHGKCVEAFIARNLLKAGAILVDGIHIKWKAALVFMVAAKNDLTTGSEIRCPVCLSEMGNLLRI